MRSSMIAALSLQVGVVDVVVVLHCPIPVDSLQGTKLSPVYARGPCARGAMNERVSSLVPTAGGPLIEHASDIVCCGSGGALAAIADVAAVVGAAGVAGVAVVVDVGVGHAVEDSLVDEPMSFTRFNVNLFEVLLRAKSLRSC